MGNFKDKLKKRWGVTSTFQVVMILLVFALTGYSTLYAQRYLKNLIGVSKESPFIIKFLVELFLVLPLYTIILLCWGYLLGQKAFFLRFIRAKVRLLSGKMKS